MNQQIKTYHINKNKIYQLIPFLWNINNIHDNSLKKTIQF